MKARRLLAEIMKKYRKKNKLSQEKFAERCGLSADEISLIECEKISPRFDIAYRILEAVGIDLEKSLCEVFEKRE